jgi:hypothetical protein
MNWRAIAIGAGVGVGIGLVTLTFSLVTNLHQDRELGPWLAWASRAVGFGADVATGAVAGWVAGTRGAVHGLLAGLLATLAGHAIGMGSVMLRFGVDAYAGILPEVWAATLTWALVGVLISAVSGLVAAPMGARAQAARPQ